MFSHFFEFVISIIKNLHRFNASSEFKQNWMLISFLRRLSKKHRGFPGVKIQVLKYQCYEQRAKAIFPMLKAKLQWMEISVSFKNMGSTYGNIRYKFLSLIFFCD